MQSVTTEQVGILWILFYSSKNTGNKESSSLIMPSKHCVYASCNSDNRYPEDGVFFIPFPKPHLQLDKSARWLKACNRSDFSLDNITKYTYICNKHFIGGDGPTSEHPDPIHCMESKIKVRRVNSKFDYRVPNQVDQVLLPSEINGTPELLEESEFVLLETLDEVVEEDINTIKIPMIDGNSSDAAEPVDAQNINTEVQEPAAFSDFERKCDQECQANPWTRDTTTETCLEVEGLYIKKLLNENAALRLQLEKNLFSYDELRRNETAFEYYTSLNYHKFDALWSFLDPEASRLQLWKGRSTTLQPRSKHYKQKLSPKAQLTLCLVRLRGGFLLKDLSFRTGLSESYISKIIVTWIQLLYLKFKDLNIFPSRQITAKKGLPACFEKFKNIRVIVDGMEINIQRPQDYREQGNTYSAYKAHNTHKFLIGVVPTGGICFVSTAFEGSISDRELFRQSGIIEILQEGDAVMADRGFNVRDLCNSKKCSLYIPPFLKGREALTAEEVFLTREIAAARIHVERAIGRIKEYRLLQKTLPLSLSFIMPQIVFVIAMLVNFQEPLTT